MNRWAVPGALGVLAVGFGVFLVLTGDPKPIPRSAIAGSHRAGSTLLPPLNEPRSAGALLRRARNGDDTAPNASVDADPFGVPRWSPRPAGYAHQLEHGPALYFERALRSRPSVRRRQVRAMRAGRGLCNG